MSLHNCFPHAKLSSRGSILFTLEIQNKEQINSKVIFQIFSISKYLVGELFNYQDFCVMWKKFLVLKKDGSGSFPGICKSNNNYDSGLVPVITVSLKTFIPTELSVFSRSIYHCHSKCRHCVLYIVMRI